MADIVEKITFDDADLIASLQNIDSKMAALNDKIREAEMTYEGAFATAAQAMEDVAKAVEEAKQAATKLAAETAKASQASGQFRSALKEQIRDLNVFGQNIGSVVDGLGRKAAAMRAVASSVGGASNALKVFKVALVSTGIGAIVVALGSLVALLTKTQKGIDTVNVVLKSFGATVDVIIDRAAKLGGSLVKLFSGDFKGAINDAKSAVTGLGQEVSKEVAQAAELERRTQRLRDANRELNVSYAERRKEIKELNLLGEDTTKREGDRIAALRKAGDIEKELLSERLKNAKEELAIIEEKNAMGESLSGDLDKEAEARINLANIEAESLELQTTLQNKLNAVEQQANAAREASAKARAEAARKASEELQKQVDAIEAAYKKLELARLSPEDRLKAEADIARAAVDEEFKKLEQLAAAAGKEVDLSKEKTELLKAIDQEYYRSLQSLRAKSLEEIGMLKLKELAIESDSAEKAAAAIANIQPASLDESRVKKSLESFDDFKDRLSDKLGISKEELELIGQSVGQVFDLWTKGTQEAIARNQDLIDSIRERRSAIEDDLDEQLALQEKGLANNVATKQRELEAIKKEEEKAQKEQERLQKKAAVQQLIADSAKQVSNLVTMASGVLANSGSLGLLGIPIALAAIAGFIGVFSAFKAQAKGAAGSDVRLAGGGAIADSGATGFVNRSGRTDRHGGRGHRVEDSNLVLGGNEFVVSEGPANRHAEFLAALNSGRFNEMDLMAELAGSRVHIDAAKAADRFARRAEIVARIQDHEDKAFQVRAMDAVMGKHIGGVVRELERNGGRAYFIPKGGGKLVIEDGKGGKRIVDHS